MAGTRSGRFEILGKLGEGGMGVVYEAYDRERDMKVALKTMRHLDSGSLYDFKREFRAVSDLSHPNIVALYELIADGDECCFTMEVVRGDDILGYVRAGRQPGRRPGQSLPKILAMGSMQEPAAGTDPRDPALRTRTMTTGTSPMPSTLFQKDVLTVFTPPRAGPLPLVDEVVDITRVRDAFGQLARALHALHQAGLVHRDLKPSNIRVTENGRAVLLDFGIVALEPTHGQVSGKKRAVGTPAYMAPEQARDASISAAADWYAFGVMLYEALTGERPFKGNAIEILRAKMWQRPTPLGRLVQGVPQDLHTVCIRLLSKEPALRPSATDVLRCFKEPERTTIPRLSVPLRQHTANEVFVGRAEELARLRRAYAGARTGDESWMFISSAPGLGKSALLRHLLTQLSGRAPSYGVSVHLEPEFGVDEQTGEWTNVRVNDRAGPLIVRGRCHERETLAYNVFDGMVDSLSHALLALAQADVDAVIPEDIDLLARLFPVLRRIPAVEARERYLDVEPRDLRFRAALALRILLARLSQIRPIIIHIDDMHWADGDSWALLIQLCTAYSDQERARLLFVGTLRTQGEHDRSERDHGDGDHGDHGGDIDRGRAHIDHLLAGHAPVRHLVLDVLSPDDRALLRERLCASNSPEQAAIAASAWDEAGGNPLLLVELARYLEEQANARDRGREPGDEDSAGEDSAGEDSADEDSAGDLAPIDLAHVLYRRISRAPEDARALLDAVSVAVEPLPLRVLADALGMASEPSDRALNYLRARNLVQVQDPGPLERILPYHERIRDTTMAHLPDARTRALHRAIAEKLVDWPHAGLAALAEHWRSAGDFERARTYLIEAAELAHAQLAFERAAALYRQALDLASPREADADSEARRADDDSERAILQRLGNTLQLAGHSYEAASAYQRAAAMSQGDEAVELKRLSAENWLRSGHVSQGIAALIEVLDSVGVVYPRSRGHAIRSLLMQRVRLRLRGKGYRKRPLSDIPAHELARLDTLYAAASTLGLIDHVRGGVLQTHHLARALELGEEHRVCRALAVESAYLLTKRSSRRADEASSRVLTQARELDDPYLVGVALMMRGGVQLFTGRVHQAIASLRECEDVTGHARQAVEWERVTARYLLSLARIATGDFEGAARIAERYTTEAELRNDVYARIMFTCIPTTWWLLCQDRPDVAERNLSTALRGWPDDTYYVANYVKEYAEALVLLYRGRAEDALAHITATRARVDRLMLTRTPWVRCEVYTGMARAAIAANELGLAYKYIRVIERAKLEYMDGVAALLRAGLHHRAGRSKRARAALESALARFREIPATHLVAVCEILLGRLLGSPDGDDLVVRGHASLRACGVIASERMLDFLAPGFASGPGDHASHIKPVDTKES